MSQAHDEDTWCHLKEYPGPHMWLKGGVITLSKQKLYSVALRLKKKTKHAHENAVEVIYIRRRKIKKKRHMKKVSS
jgi:predicted ribosome quality control (RQC) complex YloA/Tae2 family protein